MDINTIKANAAKYYKRGILFIVIVVSLSVGRVSNDFVQFNSLKKTEATAPLTYQDISTAHNERGETIILKKNSNGYSVMTVLDTTVTRTLSNQDLASRYKAKE